MKFQELIRARYSVRAYKPDPVEKDKLEVTVPWFPYRLVSIGQALFPRLFASRVAARASRHRDE